MPDTTIESLIAAVEKEVTDANSMLALQAQTKALYEEALTKVQGLTPEQQQAMNFVYAKLTANDQPIADALKANVPPVDPPVDPPGDQPGDQPGMTDPKKAR